MRDRVLESRLNEMYNKLQHELIQNGSYTLDEEKGIELLQLLDDLDEHIQADESSGIYG